MKINEYMKSQQGVTAVGTIIFVAFMAVAVLYALVIGKPFMYSVFYNKEIKDITKNCLNKDDNTFIKRLKSAARENSFIIKEQDIIIDRAFDNEYLSVKLKYSYDLSVPFYERTLIFKTAAKQQKEERKRSGSGGVKSKQQKTKGFLEKIKGTFGL